MSPSSVSLARRPATGRHASSLRRVLIGALTVLCSGLAAQGQWPGWRGVSREGRSDATHAPIRWDADTNVRWKTAIPGSGHSSPIVAGNAVYLTAAGVARPYSRRVLRTRVVLWVLSLALLTAVIVLTTSREVGSGREARGHLAGGVMLGMVVAACGIVLFGEEYLHYDRGLERAWLAASAMGTLCLCLWAVAAPTAGRHYISATLLLAYGIILQLVLPGREHAYEDGPLSPKSIFHYAVVALPLLTAIIVLSLHPSRRPYPSEPPDDARSRDLPRRLLRWVGALIVAVLLCLIIGVVISQQAKTGTTLSVTHTYRPIVAWWLMLLCAASCGALHALWRRRPHSTILQVIATVACGVSWATLSLGLLEHIVIASPFLAYQLGAPHFRPILGWHALGLLLGLSLLAAVVSALLGRQRLARAGVILDVIVASSAIALAGLHLVYVLYMPRAPELLRSVISVNRHTGEVRWVRQGLSGAKAAMHTDNSSATPTPVTDGRRVYAWFGTAGLMCTDTHGELIWTNRKLPFEARHGVATSPILCGTSVIILSESELGGYLAAVDCDTGDIRWKTERGKSIHRYAGNCRTPSVKMIGGRRVIVVWGHTDISGYDPSTGRELWSHEIGDLGEMNNPVTSIVSDDRRFYLAGPRATLAVAREELPTKQDPVVWSEDTSDGAQCPSPVLAGGLLFAVSDVGTAYCMDALTGRTVWRERLRKQHYASPVVIGNRVYFTDTRGKTTVVTCEPKFRHIADNDLSEVTYASMAPVDGRLYIRTQENLYCIGAP